MDQWLQDRMIGWLEGFLDITRKVIDIEKELTNWETLDEIRLSTQGDKLPNPN